VPSQQSASLPQSAVYFALACALLAMLRWLDQSIPGLSLWLFIALSLTVGMGHGALDAVLLLAQFKPLRNVAAYALVYLLLVVGCGALLAMSPGWALLALLAMSVWHFGELYQPSLATRLMVGGASVMAPMLLSNSAMAILLKPVLGADYSTSWLVWYWLAVAWAIGAAGWVLWAGVQRIYGRGRSLGHTELQDNATTHAALELAAVLALNAVLSPLMAFAVYFGLWHSLSHIARVLRAMARHSSRAKVSPQRLTLAMALTGLATAALLWVLWRWLPAGQGVGGLSLLGAQAFWVQWLIVALAAVTLPHMLLVGYSHRWLGR
jgi:beta-carotene 15,15'-dioxygenase